VPSCPPKGKKSGGAKAASSAGVLSRFSGAISDSSGLPDSVVAHLFSTVVQHCEPRDVAHLLRVGKRFCNVAYGSQALWKQILERSRFNKAAFASPLVDVETLFQANPQKLVAGLLSSACAYCGKATDYYFALHSCRVCASCFLAGDRPNNAPGASFADKYPSTKLDMFLPKPPGDPRCALAHV